MKVFCFDETDWVAAESRDEAVEFYFKETDVSETIDAVIIEEAPLTETMWYGFDKEDNEVGLLIEDKKTEKTFLIEENFREWGIAICITFEEALKYFFKEYKTPFLISSIEW